MLIDQARRKRQWTLTQLANRAGLSVSYVGDICIGKRRLSVPAAVKLGAALGIEPRRLLIEQLDADLARQPRVS